MTYPEKWKHLRLELNNDYLTKKIPCVYNCGYKSTEYNINKHELICKYNIYSPRINHITKETRKDIKKSIYLEKVPIKKSNTVPQNHCIII